MCITNVHYTEGITFDDDHRHGNTDLRTIMLDRFVTYGVIQNIYDLIRKALIIQNTHLLCSSGDLLHLSQNSLKRHGSERIISLSGKQSTDLDRRGRLSRTHIGRTELFRQTVKAVEIYVFLVLTQDLISFAYNCGRSLTHVTLPPR